jgi:hypothetical protein
MLAFLSERGLISMIRWQDVQVKPANGLEHPGTSESL